MTKRYLEKNRDTSEAPLKPSYERIENNADLVKWAVPFDTPPTMPKAAPGTISADDTPEYSKDGVVYGTGPEMIAKIEQLRTALREIADPEKLTSYGDPGVLRRHARYAIQTEDSRSSGL